MKKLATLLLAAGMVMGASAPADAVDVKVDYRHRVSFSTQSLGFEDAENNKEDVRQRVRLGLTFAASENLKGYVQFQMGKTCWGTSSGTAGDYDVQTRQAYMDWKVPATPVQVRMGRMQFGLPADALGCNAVRDAGWGTQDGIVVTSPVTDWLGVTALWTRLNTEGTDVDQGNNDDLFGLAANLKFDGISGAIWGAYATFDDGVLSGTADYNFAVTEGDAYWVGFTSTLSFFDPFTLKLSAAYGEFNSNHGEVQDQDGWNVQAKASYKTTYGTPVLGAWYFSGNDEKGEGLMPSAAGYFAPTRTYHDGAKGLNGGQAYYLPSGNWGVQAGVEGMSFLTDLSHDFLVTYIQGTNDKDWEDCNDEYLSEDDSLVSFDFISTYKIYKNLAAHLELSYIINDFNASAKNEGFDQDDWRAELTFEYKF